MTGNELFLLIRGLNSISEQMTDITDKEGFSLTEEYPIRGYTVEQIRNMCSRACAMINSVDFVPNCPHQ